MFYEIHITKSAEQDLLSTVDYISQVLYNPQAAGDLMDEVERKVASLSQFPQQFSLVDDPILKAWGVRFVAINSYIMFYTVSETSYRVNIIRFLYGKRNWLSILKQGVSLE